MTKDEAKREIEALFEKWAVPRSLTSVTEVRGGIKATLVKPKGAECISVTVPTGRYSEASKIALDDLRVALIKSDFRKQSDVEDYTEGLT